MFKLDDNFLVELGLGSLPPAEKNKMLSHIYETLEMKVGMRLAEKMSNEQLDEFESYINGNDEQGALKWLETNFPNYKQVVAEELEKLKSEVKQVAPQILAQAASAPQQPQQPAVGQAPPQQQAAMPAGPPQQGQTAPAPAAYGANQPAQYQQSVSDPQQMQPAQPATGSYSAAPQQPHPQQSGLGPAENSQPSQAYASAPPPSSSTQPLSGDDSGSFDLSGAQTGQPHVPQPGVDAGGVSGSYADPTSSAAYAPAAAPVAPSAPSNANPASPTSVYDYVTANGSAGSDPLASQPAASSAQAAPSGNDPYVSAPQLQSPAEVGGAFNAEPVGNPAPTQPLAQPLTEYPQQPAGPSSEVQLGAAPAPGQQVPQQQGQGPSEYQAPPTPPVEPYQPPQ